MDRTPAYVQDMLVAAGELAGIVSGVSLPQFVGDRIRCLAAEKLFINLGEAASRISPAQAALIPGVPWKEVIGLRNILAHQYEQVEHEVLYRTAVVNIPPVIDALRAWLATVPRP